ncbi:MAG: DNA mismatch repair endonuclease MutL [Spirochaetales bacterium]|nr:DNA mismatch repair endonuclease MutL [Spirochaetales bacterium]
MKNETKTKARRIEILREDVALKIAAGEVIDRPFSVLRELLDNSIDADSTEIEIQVNDGGVGSIRVSDNGTGMSDEDLKLCYLTHATSKIKEEEDIYHISTLGFRGEALSSIATCARLEVVSRPRSDKATEAHQLLVKGGKLLNLAPHKGQSGTTINVSDLFFNMPARKKFLKSPSGESQMCASTFLDKALPFPQISFRYMNNDKLKYFFPQSDQLLRCQTAFKESITPEALESSNQSWENFRIDVVAAKPDVVRRDKRFIRIFVNRRRVYEYSLIQAVEYGYSGFVQGKDYPACFVFIDLEPELVDFNIHPAKKECRIRNLPEIRSALIGLLKQHLEGAKIYVPRKTESSSKSPDQNNYTSDFFDSKAYTPSTSYSPPKSYSTVFERPVKNYSDSGFASLPRQPISSIHTSQIQKDDKKSYPFTYLGQLWNLFLLAQMNDSFYMIDQHAAHEKILFVKLMEQETLAQELLFPICFELDDEEDEQLSRQKKELSEYGISLNRQSMGLWEIEKLPEDLHQLKASIWIDFFKNLKGDFKDLKSKVMSMAACKMAIKEGDTLDALTAYEIIDKAFKLDNARCPHGRPIWMELSQQEMMKKVGRL